MKRIRLFLIIFICGMFVVGIHGCINLKMLCAGNKESIVKSDGIRNIDMTDEEIKKIFLTDTAGIGNGVKYISGINEGILKNIVYRKIYEVFCEENGRESKGANSEIPYLFKLFVNKKNYKTVYELYKKIYGDVKMFPVPNDYAGKVKTPYENSWGASRDYGGDRRHEGTDIMAGNNERGYFPVVSMTDGIVEKKGWLELGGYRIGIRSPSGVYYYYAHLADYADGIEEGSAVKAGDIIGTMGDTGYGKEEGTTGKFDVHLHFGIYYKMQNDAGEEEEISYNPYYILRAVERFKKEFVDNNS